MAGRGRPSRATVYQRLEQALAELNQRLGGLPSPKEAQTIWEDIWHQEAHHSTALEGNTLVLREVQALLDQGRAVGAKSTATQRLRTGTPIHRRELSCGSALTQPDPRASRLPARHHLQAAAIHIPGRDAASRCGARYAVARCQPALRSTPRSRHARAARRDLETGCHERQLFRNDETDHMSRSPGCIYPGGGTGSAIRAGKADTPLAG